MKIPTFKQFQDLLVPEAKNSVLFSAVQPQIISFRQNTLSAMAAEAAYEKIFDKADGTSGTTRQQHSPRDGGKPNTSRLESIKRGRGDRLTVEAVYYHFQFGEEDTGYADAISRELFEESTFYQHFEDKLRRMGLDTPAQGDGLDAFQFGNVKLCLAYESGMKSLDFPERDTDALFENGNLLPLEALHWSNGVSKKYGRSQEIADIKEWAEDPDPRCKIHLIHGPGGVGKTRLAAEAALQLKKLGWKVGFLPGDIRDPNTSVKLASGGVGALLIIDYPEERPKLVQAIFAALSGDQRFRVGAMCSFYVQLCENLGVEPDAELLLPITEMFERMKRGEV
ncbi:ATP-binding protein [Parasedimentitalea marina]|uniref:ATP-binding protein n=1 Tax=Parasedimentitalea marina TaxID=2483033 RepID=A0A3T0N4U4_9RHOB|nr:ATP-binding protein [Parasedimentitalea marina]AZV79060.1 ATP-binding protein [Parasedimentitalea marina]